MNNSPHPPAAGREQISRYAYIASVYFVAVGMLYLWGYWSTFHINILEYMSLTDVVKTTAYPIVSVFVFFAIGSVIGEFWMPHSDLPPGGGRHTQLGEFLNRIKRLLIAMYIGAVVAMIFFAPVRAWYLVALLISFPIYFELKTRGFLLTLIPHDSPRSIVIFVLAVLPGWAYAQGRVNAANAVDGTRFEYVVSGLGKKAHSKDVPVDQMLRLVGHAGDYLFFYDPTKKTIAILKAERGRLLILKHFPN